MHSGERDGPTKIIREALIKVGVPRAIFQLVQLTGLIESVVRSTVHHLVIRGGLEVVPETINKPPKMYRLPKEKVQKIYEVNTGPFSVALEVENKYRGFRWWKIKRSGEWN